MDAERFLENTISVLAQSSDFRTVVQSLAQLGATHLSDWCGLFTFENERTIRRLAFVRRGESSPPSLQVEALYPLDLRAATGPSFVFRTGEQQIVSNVSDEVWQSLGLRMDERVPENGVTPSIFVCMPLIAHERTLGAAVFIASDSLHFLNGNMGMARGLANAAAVAIDNAKLYREAQEANRLKDEFVAMVSHELRTPLTPMLGCIHLLRTAQLSQANFDRALDMIERNARAQVQIVEDLLDVSRIVAGKLHIVLKSVNPAPIVEASVETLRSSAEAKGVEIITKLDETQLPIEGDSHRIQQILGNLVSNAVKFTPSGGRIEISTRSDANQLVIQVTDTGIGIPADFLPHIFDRFRQVHDGSSNVRSGLGLGLAIVRHLVELHGGTIEAASAGPGRGAVFTLRFPLAAKRVANYSSGL